MLVKLIAINRIHKTEPGGELEVADNVAKVLVLLGHARYAEGHEPKAAPQPQVMRRVSRQPRGTVSAVTRRNVRSDSAE